MLIPYIINKFAYTLKYFATSVIRISTIKNIQSRYFYCPINVATYLKQTN